MHGGFSLPSITLGLYSSDRTTSEVRMRKSLIFALLFALAACGGTSGNGAGEETGEDGNGLSPAQLENGIGPIQAVPLGEIDKELADQGEELFRVKCSACHKLNERYVGPALGDVLERRTPAFVMNMMLNPEEMQNKHPEVRAMLAEYMTPMPNQQLTENDARAVVEYLREEASENSE